MDPFCGPRLSSRNFSAGAAASEVSAAAAAPLQTTVMRRSGRARSGRARGAARRLVRIPGAATKEEEVEAGMWRKVAVGARERTVMVEAMAAVGAAWDSRVWIEADNWVSGRERDNKETMGLPPFCFGLTFQIALAHSEREIYLQKTRVPNGYGGLTSAKYMSRKRRWNAT